MHIIGFICGVVGLFCGVIALGMACYSLWLLSKLEKPYRLKCSALTINKVRANCIEILNRARSSAG